MELEVTEVIELEGAHIGRWAGGAVEVMMLRRQPSTEWEGQEAEDAEFEELMHQYQHQHLTLQVVGCMIDQQQKAESATPSNVCQR